MRGDSIALGEPIVITGTYPSGARYVHLWTENEPVFGKRVRYCWVSMTDDPSDRKERLIIHAGCPDALLTQAWDMFTRLRGGEEVPATHTVNWGQGDATFTPIADITRAEKAER
jgi:hypothetical protein